MEAEQKKQEWERLQRELESKKTADKEVSEKRSKREADQRAKDLEKAKKAQAVLQGL